jgi:hypothetical protein
MDGLVLDQRPRGEVTLVAMDWPDLWPSDVGPPWPVGGYGEEAMQVTVKGGPWKEFRLERWRSHA